MCGGLREKNHVIRQLFFEDRVINVDSYVDMQQNYFISQFERLHLKHEAVL